MFVHWVFSLFAFVILVSVHQFCWSFQRINSIFHWFSLFIFCFQFLSFLLFISSFLLLALDFVCSCFSWLLRWKLRVLIWDFPSFLIYMLSAIHFPLGTALAAFPNFCFFFYFCSVQRIFKTSRDLLFDLGILWKCCLLSKCLGLSLLCFCYWFLVWFLVIGEHNDNNLNYF